MSSDSRYRRIHVVMPEELVAEIDAMVGKRHRSRFVVETIAAELQRRRLREALAEMDGALAGFDIPGWETPESAVAWVRAVRDGVEVAQSPESAA
jgi:hypothetical protein